MQQKPLSDQFIIAETSFEQAVEKFKRILAENGLPADILWVFLEDAFQRNSKFHETDFWLKIPVSDDNEKLTKKCYTIGQQRKLGVGISAFALCRDNICCSLILPKDKEDSEYLFMSPEYLKFIFLKDLPTAKLVKSDFR